MDSGDASRFCADAGGENPTSSTIGNAAVILVRYRSHFVFTSPPLIMTGKTDNLGRQVQRRPGGNNSVVEWGRGSCAETANGLSSQSRRAEKQYRWVRELTP